jgi:hypothetical protein
MGRGRVEYATMSQGEMEMSDIVVVMEEEPGISIDEAAKKLVSLGMEVANIDRENDAIEGSAPSEKVRSLKELPFVKYVRDVFNYVAEEEEAEEDVDDAGA